MTREEKIEFANSIAEDLESEGYEFEEGDEAGDSPEDLSDTELDTLMEQLLAKTKRPRRPVPII